MTTQLQRPTAKLYTFPSGGRAPPSRYRDTNKPAPYASFPRAGTHERAPKIVYGSSWYHQVAVDEAEDTWER
jgi:hypothetical protein